MRENTHAAFLWEWRFEKVSAYQTIEIDSVELSIGIYDLASELSSNNPQKAISVFLQSFASGNQLAAYDLFSLYSLDSDDIQKQKYAAAFYYVAERLKDSRCKEEILNKDDLLYDKPVVNKLFSCYKNGKKIASKGLSEQNWYKVEKSVEVIKCLFEEEEDLNVVGDDLGDSCCIIL